jgi:hypothetical protein
MLATTQLTEHSASVFLVLRFAKDESIAFGDGIGGEDKCARRTSVRSFAAIQIPL